PQPIVVVPTAAATTRAGIATRRILTNFFIRLSPPFLKESARVVDRRLTRSESASYRCWGGQRNKFLTRRVADHIGVLGGFRLQWRAVRVLGLDVGSRTIGVAVSDELGVAAHGVTTLQRRGTAKDVAQVLELVRRYQTERIVVGMPYEIDGTM